MHNNQYMVYWIYGTRRKEDVSIAYAPFLVPSGEQKDGNWGNWFSKLRELYICTGEPYEVINVSVKIPNATGGWNLSKGT